MQSSSANDTVKLRAFIILSEELEKEGSLEGLVMY